VFIIIPDEGVDVDNNFCCTCLVIVSILFNTSGDKLSGIINPYDVCPSVLLNDKLILVSSGILDKNKALLIVFGV
jgi:hypothetical protein